MSHTNTSATVGLTLPNISAPPLEHDAMMLARFGQVMHPYMRMERHIVANLFEWLFMHNLLRNVSVDYGEENTECKNAQQAMELMFNLDECYLHVSGHWISFIFGNGNNGMDMISDYSYSEGDADGFQAAMDAFDTDFYEGKA